MLNWFLNTGGAAWVTTLDPATVADEMSVSDIQLINANLVRIDSASLTPEPDLATWTTSPDRNVWTFTIRPNARFSNGDPVTADDAAWSLTRALLPATRSAVAITYLSHIVGATDVATGKSTTLAGVRALGIRTLRIELDSPISYFLAALSLPTGDVLDRRVLQGKSPDSFVTNTCSGNVGAGPFRLACLNKRSSRTSFYARGTPPALNFKPNPFYYGARPHIHIHLPFITSADTTWRQYQQGRLDGVPVPDSHLEAARHMSGFLQARLLQTDSIMPNMAAPPFDNINCRLALAYAVNRKDLTQRVLNGTEEPLYGVVPPGLLGYLPAEEDIPGYNLPRARAYLKNCPGHLNGVTLTYDSSNPTVSREYRALRDELRAVGARIDLRPLGSHRWLNIYSQPLSAARPPTNLLQYLWIADYPDPQDWCDTLLHTGGNFNLAGFSNPTYDRLVDEATMETKSTRRAQLYRQAQRIVVREGAWVAVGSAVGTYLVSSHVHGMAATFNSIQPTKDDWSRVSISG